MATTTTGQAGGSYLPTQKTIGNKTVLPKIDTTKLIGKIATHTGPDLMKTGEPVASDLRKELQTLDPNTGRVDKPGFGMDYSTTSTTGGGLMGMPPTSAGQKVSTTDVKTTSQPAGQNISVTQPVKPASPEFNYAPTQYQNVNPGTAPTMNTPQTEFTANQYQSNGYTGVQGNTEFNYDPRSESLVQNQLTGLLDPNSALMKRAVSQTQEAAAGRGLQSSSIAAGAGMGAMIDRALPIAQQDAQTYGNAQQLGWQQSFTADQNNLNRRHDASMFDKQGQLQTNLQNNQFGFQNTQANADRAMQAELQQLQYKQQMGMLDAQGAQRMQELNAQQGFAAQMQELQYQQQLGTLDFQGQQRLQQMEREAQLTQQRDYLSQQFQRSNMDKTFLQQLELTQLQWQRDDAIFAKNIDANAQAQYRASSAEAYNRYLEQVSAVYGNPNMSIDQQKNAAEQLKIQWNENQKALRAIFLYGFEAAPVNPIVVDTGVTDPYNPTTPRRGGGGGGGSRGGSRGGGGGGDPRREMER